MTEGSSVRTTLELPAPKALARILLVDDDFAIQEGVAEFLEGEGFSVVSASNGLDALNQLRSGLRVDAIVLDVTMPMMDGWDFRDNNAPIPRYAASRFSSSPRSVLRATPFASNSRWTMFSRSRSTSGILSGRSERSASARIWPDVFGLRDIGQTARE